MRRSGGRRPPLLVALDRAEGCLGGRKARVICLPTAAGKEGDGSIGRWSRMGVEHFERLGAAPRALRIIDRQSADDPEFEQELESADIIYFSGGDPIYLHQTLDGSRAWSAAQRAWERGAVYAGCSAGAMILGRSMPNLRMAGTNSVTGFGLLPASYVFPHFDAMPIIFKPMIMALRRTMKPGAVPNRLGRMVAPSGKRACFALFGVIVRPIFSNRRRIASREAESSTSGRKAAGISRPRTGCSQRTSASTPVTARVMALTFG